MGKLEAVFELRGRYGVNVAAEMFLACTMLVFRAVVSGSQGQIGDMVSIQFLSSLSVFSTFSSSHHHTLPTL